MKYLVKFFVITFLVIFSTSSFAENKIVVLDLKYILNNSKAGKGAQDFLKKTYKNNVKKFADSENLLKKEEQKLLSQKSTLSKNDYKSKTDDLRKKVVNYQKKRRAALDKIASQRTQSREALIKAIDPIVANYIKENNVSLVVDKKVTFGGNPENDITSLITKELNKSLPKINLK